MYKGRSLKLLKGIKIGDQVSVHGNQKDFKGILMPRNELADDEHIVIKLDNGYNMGISLDKIIRVGLVKKSNPVPSNEDKQFKTELSLPTVSIIGTGGTIASKIDYKTGAVAPAFSARELHTAVPELSEIANIKTRMLFNILSENMTPLHWKEIAEVVMEELNDGSDGVVIAHGTDTMGYTSAALSFMLKELGKPVVLVGSQRSSDRPSSDSALNLISAVKLAVADTSGVFVVMHENLNDENCLIHYGTRARKLHSSRRDAFRSVNATPAGRITDRVELKEGNKKRTDGKARVDHRFNSDVALVRIHPGMKKEALDHFIENYSGIVLEGTGLGHLPEELLPSIKEAKGRGIPIVMTSQTIYGRVDMKVYATGRHLLELGVIPGGDMLPETAFVKLMHILGITTDPDEIRNLMLQNMAGEHSDTTRSDTFLR